MWNRSFAKAMAQIRIMPDSRTDRSPRSGEDATVAVLAMGRQRITQETQECVNCSRKMVAESMLFHSGRMAAGGRENRALFTPGTKVMSQVDYLFFGSFFL